MTNRATMTARAAKYAVLVLFFYMIIFFLLNKINNRYIIDDKS